MQEMSLMTAKAVVTTLIAVGGMLVGAGMAVMQAADGIGATEVLIGLNVLVLGAIWQLGREVSTLRGELKAKASVEDIRREIREWAVDHLSEGGQDAA